ncbi:MULTISPECIES: cupin domain-containing protein [unclassified Sphingomonas]|uniref:cupin domain-containing protein n=1 Tax=unclassified Sphingomonas TaxID=196159 RepID=UPI0006FFA5BF|nr:MULTISPECIES: cupin domain-containing protein [unclassified Sphingomonas]KQX23263.1 hypothetical protein ASD17_02775 [Sphingomonas sp. Root1294]KQY68111.1 hypothetical protein ASD39_05295 [Sphingomonas sp. Root50]KRB91003.1 hypothetical protein ASE22_12095 [Sphingomonas sp. Root720]
MADHQTSDSATLIRAYVRKAGDHRIELPHQPGQAHRSAAGWTIDYRLQEITGGDARSISTVPGHFIDKPAFGSPWHHHDCDLQVAMVLEGSIELGYRGGRYGRAGKGDILFIPGHVMHDVSNPSSDYQVAEITFPGSFGTVEGVEPASDIDTPARTWGSSAAIRQGEARGVIAYLYPVMGPYDRRFRIRRLRRSRTSPFEPGSLAHDDRYRFLMVMQGWMDVDIDGQTLRVETGDIVVLPKGVACEQRAMSDELEMIETSVLEQA